MKLQIKLLDLIDVQFNYLAIQVFYFENQLKIIFKILKPFI